MAISRFGADPHCLPLAAVPSAVRLARSYVKGRLNQYGHADLTDRGSIITSELVTNAVKAVGTLDERRNWATAKPQTIAVCCYSNDGHAVVEVWDSDPRPPMRKQPTEDDEGGRGLLLVETLSRRWGYRWPTTGGKVVWCVL